MRIPPRHALTPLPTPLQPVPRFSAAIGREVLVKRDDVGSIGYAGNKVRKLERILARADDDGIEALVIVGAAQSNAARALAAAAAASGRRCVVVVPGEPPRDDATEGNLLLTRLFGADVRFLGPMGWAEAEAAGERVREELEAGGTRAMALPAGCSTPLGAAAFVAAHRELLDQLDGREPAAIVHASSSGGTAAGLHLGRLLHGGPPVLSVDVGRLYGDMHAHVAALATRAAGELGTARDVTAEDVGLTYDFLGEGYAAPTAEGLEAIRLLAATEGIVCDPVYSGKALAAVRAGAVDGPVVFWHTGGAQSVLTRRASEQLLGQ